MNITVLTVSIFGLFSLIGGIIGFTKAGSIVSLLAGSFSGIILLLSAYGISKKNQSSIYIALLVAIILGGRFLVTLIESFKVMSDLLMVILSLVTILLVGRVFIKCS